MNRDAFLQRVRDLILRNDTTDGPALVRMLEVNCNGARVLQPQAMILAVANAHDGGELWAHTRRDPDGLKRAVAENIIRAQVADAFFTWRDTMPVYATMENAKLAVIEMLTASPEKGEKSRYIRAIKLYREKMSGTPSPNAGSPLPFGLKDAKDAVDAIVAELGLSRAELM